MKTFALLALLLFATCAFAQTDIIFTREGTGTRVYGNVQTPADVG